MRGPCSLAAVAGVLATLLAPAGARAADQAPPTRPRPVRLDPRDPEPLVTRDYLDLAVSIQRGDVRVDRVLKGSFPRPRPLLRFRGRFEVRLYADQRLLDLVRFSFPLTGAAGERTVPNIQLDRALARGVSARASVRVPFSPQVTRVTVLDPRTGRQVPVDIKPWIAPPLRLPAAGPQRTSVFAKPASP